MSRLIVKNLPKNVTEDEIKDSFGEKGVITDVQLKFTEDGKFRRFGFVGYKTKEEASNALTYFNNSYFKNSKIVVELCAGLGDPSKPKSWSKYALDSKVNHDKIAAEEDKSKKKSKKNDAVEKEDDKKKKKKKDEKSKVEEIINKHKDDPLFNEFIKSHIKGDTKIWSNDDLLVLNGDDDKNSDDSGKGSGKDDSDDAEDEKIAKKAISDKEYFESLKAKSQGIEVKKVEESKKKGPQKFFTVKVHGLGCNHKKKDVKQLFHGVKPKSIRIPPKIRGIAYVGFKTEKQMKQALAKDKTFYDGKRVFVSKYVEKEQSGEKEQDCNKSRWKRQEDDLKNTESIAESGKIFLRNLCYTTTEDDIKAIFEKYGPVTEVSVPIDMFTRKSKGFGTVTFLMPEHAVKAFEELDGSIQNGRYLHLLPAKSTDTLEDKLSDGGLSFKDKKELKLKATAGHSHNWNALFLDQNAVADSIAKKYNITKEKLFEDNKGTSLAVLLAQGETHFVLETKKFLETNGVHLNAFNQAPKVRSKAVILVKNLAAGTSVQEIREMFEKFGVLGRVVLPPTGITALVEFIEPFEARKAFNKLAYSKFKSLPLYLEWAPADSFSSSPPAVSTSTSSEKTENTKTPQNTTQENNTKDVESTKDDKTEAKEDESDEEDDEEPEPDTTLFVKNLNFSTTEEQLKKHFEKCGRLHYSTVSKKKDPNNPNNKLSMGYGFVRYKLKSSLEKAMKELQSSLLDGKTLELKRSERTLQTDIKVVKKTSKSTKQTGTKILVRNVPFQANADEIKDLFKVFGEVKSVRLPKKMVGDEKHRGFCFVEFYTKKEAKTAFESLCLSTHLYGRRLNLEWAQTEEAVEDLRKRTAKHFHQEPSKRSKKGTFDPEAPGLEDEN
ncbi:probable RNA-binding protein 19 [Copidosoma floridanum]|uniref:probable RNA-binding protein 19 n=1 Tax=Copidosoma floridanum TaxID=29053 RepID=UPI0006C9C8E1|nr:probable RNA-binding protein 19 [Copidosoma floridanum]